MSGAIVPLNDLSNRSEKRKFMKDAKKAALDLEIVNQSFIHELFNAPSYVAYDDIYSKYLDEWNSTIKRLTTSKKIFHAGIDVLFFSREYKPQIKLK